MCQKCFDSAKRHFPDCPDSEIGDLLFCATAFPFGEPELIDKQLANAVAAGCRTHEEAMAWADADFDRQMTELWEGEKCAAMMRL